MYPSISPATFAALTAAPLVPIREFILHGYMEMDGTLTTLGHLAVCKHAHDQATIDYHAHALMCEHTIQDLREQLAHTQALLRGRRRP